MVLKKSSVLEILNNLVSNTLCVRVIPDRSPARTVSLWSQRVKIATTLTYFSVSNTLNVLRRDAKPPHYTQKGEHKMKKLFLTLLLLITCLSSQLEARIIFGNSEIQNLLAAYSFNREDYGHIIDQSINGINGILDGNAKLIKGKYSSSLSLEDANSRFVALKTVRGPHYLDYYAAHTICAWVKVPEQDTDFTISLQFIDPENFPGTPISELETVTGTQLAVKPNGNLGAISHSRYFDMYEPHDVEPFDEPATDEPATEPPPVIEKEEPIIESEDSFFSIGHYVETTHLSINDDNWHHLALVYVPGYPGILKLYVDGELVCENNEYYPGHLWDPSYYITLISVGEGATGVIDDLCLFYQALDETYIDVLYELGLDKIMTVADVAAKNKLTTTWGDMKSRR